MFGNSKPKKNRPFTPQEFEGELELAKLMHRPPRKYFYDMPFYPYVPPTPVANQPFVNFRLNYTE